MLCIHLFFFYLSHWFLPVEILLSVGVSWAQGQGRGLSVRTGTR